MQYSFGSELSAHRRVLYHVLKVVYKIKITKIGGFYFNLFPIYLFLGCFQYDLEI